VNPSVDAAGKTSLFFTLLNMKYGDGLQIRWAAVASWSLMFTPGRRGERAVVHDLGRGESRELPGRLRGAYLAL